MSNRVVCSESNRIDNKKRIQRPGFILLESNEFDQRVELNEPLENIKSVRLVRYHIEGVPMSGGRPLNAYYILSLSTAAQQITNNKNINTGLVLPLENLNTYVDIQTPKYLLQQQPQGGAKTLTITIKDANNKHDPNLFQRAFFELLIEYEEIFRDEQRASASTLSQIYKGSRY